jgi:ABC-2 type transport system ATP-binding protein
MGIIDFKSVSKRYDGFLALDKVSFSVKKGEIFAIIGPNGAGKTTILKLICGLLTPSSGKLSVDSHTDPNEMRKSIGYMPEESALYENMTVRDYLTFFADLYDIPRKRSTEKIGSLLSFLSLSDKMISDLSKGMRRKALIARSLVNDPTILVYDEPASGLDPGIAESLLMLIKELRDKGATVVISAHDLAQIEEISDSVIMLKAGKIDVTGSVADIKKRFGKKEYMVSYRTEGTVKSKAFSSRESMLEFIKANDVVDIETDERTLHKIFLDKYG